MSQSHLKSRFQTLIFVKCIKGFHAKEILSTIEYIKHSLVNNFDKVDMSEITCFYFLLYHKIKRGKTDNKQSYWIKPANSCQLMPRSQFDSRYLGFPQSPHILSSSNVKLEFFYVTISRHFNNSSPFSARYIYRYHHSK